MRSVQVVRAACPVADRKIFKYPRAIPGGGGEKIRAEDGKIRAQEGQAHVSAVRYCSLYRQELEAAFRRGRRKPAERLVWCDCSPFQWHDRRKNHPLSA